jgi:hypothetical protein
MKSLARDVIDEKSLIGSRLAIGAAVVLLGAEGSRHMAASLKEAQLAHRV